MKKQLLILLLTVNLFANEPMLKATPYEEVAKAIGKGKATLLEVGSDSCHSCQIMGKLLYKEKEEHPNYNIYFINVKEERDVAFKLKIQMIPTQILLDANGSEIDRHVGLLEKEDLDAIFEEYFDGNVSVKRVQKKY